MVGGAVPGEVGGGLGAHRIGLSGATPYRAVNAFSSAGQYHAAMARAASGPNTSPTGQTNTSLQAQRLQSVQRRVSVTPWRRSSRRNRAGVQAAQSVHGSKQCRRALPLGRMVMVHRPFVHGAPHGRPGSGDLPAARRAG
jgi:hypothetical protein